VIAGGKLVDVIIDDMGYGYTYANIEVVDPAAVQDPEDIAVVEALLDIGNINSQQSIIENLAIPGTVDSISIVNPGINFTGTPSVTISGDGTGATATAEVFNGMLRRINITNPGRDYTFANVTLFDVFSGSGYELSANVSPPKGHGANAVKELYSNILMFYGNLTGSKVAGFTIENDYHQFGLIKNPRTIYGDLELPDAGPHGTYVVYVTGTIDTDAFFVGSSFGNDTIPVSFLITAIYTNSTTTALEVIPNTTLEWFDTIGQIPNGNGPTEYLSYEPGFEDQAITPEYVKSYGSVFEKTSTYCYTVNANVDVGTFTVDSILTKGVHSYIIIAATPTQLLVQAINGGTISNGDTLNIGTTPLTVISVIQPPVDRRSGNILTVDNRPSFTQSAEQSVTTRTVIKF
jgi:hypothetical protein